MNHGETVQAAKAKWERKGHDYYPTPLETTQAVADWMLPRYGAMRVREPCCGEGHISHVLLAAGHEVVSSDIRHTGYGTGGVDYLALPESDPNGYDMEAVVTNPPFSAAEQVIRRALRDAPVVAMLLSNDYWHAARRAALFNSRKPAAILALTWRPAFLAEERGNSPLSNFAWTVWDDAHEGETAYIVLPRPRHVPRWPGPTPAVRLARHCDYQALCGAAERLAGLDG